MKTSFWAIILLLLTSCQGSEKCDRLMQLADSLIENTNDFATASTLIFDSIDTQTDKLSHRQLMRHKLLQLSKPSTSTNRPTKPPTPPAATATGSTCSWCIRSFLRFIPSSAYRIAIARNWKK